MTILSKLEARLVRFYTTFPNLPVSARTWLGNNAWWIILIIAILDAFGCLSLVGGFIGVLALSHRTDIYSVGYGSLPTVQTALSLLAGIIGTILYFSAVRPLKEKRLLGWQLVFYAQLVGFAVSVISLVLTVIVLGSPITIIGTLVGFVIGVAFTLLWLYFVFQIRGEFGSRIANAAEAVIVPKKSTRKK